ncbi:hypothetical protein Corgl_0920 [Coriobacterium glomerans PW2]|uniref:Uncharacterized protein n=1 Tax=Coriobacterium glomerans (strain ATCC 49209 / DSM 20642 / JCM 10262 / PW2) TaxID=700015 RepID=F2N9K2_CORGP|nr:hypothetical protein Corgl_0920 [Coriobacterium glomerans PW2]
MENSDCRAMSAGLVGDAASPPSQAADAAAQLRASNRLRAAHRITQVHIGTRRSDRSMRMVCRRASAHAFCVSLTLRETISADGTAQTPLVSHPTPESRRLRISSRASSTTPPKLYEAQRRPANLRSRTSLSSAALLRRSSDSVTSCVGRREPSGWGRRRRGAPAAHILNDSTGTFASHLQDALPSGAASVPGCLTCRGCWRSLSARWSQLRGSQPAVRDAALQSRSFRPEPHPVHDGPRVQKMLV